MAIDITHGLSPRLPKARQELLGLPITLASRNEALESLKRVLRAAPSSSTRWICFLNAHNFNSAMLDGTCGEALRRAHAVYPDGVAIRVAARLLGVGVVENLPGTDLVPDLLRSTGGRCFLVGDKLENVERAARELERRFPDWSVVGFCSGYLESPDAEREVVRRVREAEPDLLLLGMGAPRQERFIMRYAADLNVPLCICVGGLFGYWNNKLRRAPAVLRAMCLEWLWILVQQPQKLHRYTVGIAMFFATVFLARARSRHGA